LLLSGKWSATSIARAALLAVISMTASLAVLAVTYGSVPRRDALALLAVIF